MAIDDNTTYGLTGAQVKELPGKIEAVKGLAKVLTIADYNYPANNPDGYAVWLLGSGFYQNGTSGQAKLYLSTSISITLSVGQTFPIIKKYTNYWVWTGVDEFNRPEFRYAREDGTGAGAAICVTSARVSNTLTETSSGYVLDARQGKTLKDLIDSIAIRGAGAPTTSTVGEVGQLYEDGTNGVLYQLKSIDITVTPNTYKWEEVGGGSGEGVTELTTADYNANSSNWNDTDPTNFNCVALWKLDDGTYMSSSATLYISKTTGGATGAVMYNIQSMDSLKNITKYGPSLSPKLTIYTVVANGTETSSALMATLADLYADPSTRYRVQIGASAQASVNNTVAIGKSAKSTGGDSVSIGTSAVDGTRASANGAVAIGADANASAQGSVAIGKFSSASSVGEMNVGTSNANYGYSNSNYRLLTGLYDGQSAHDAATVGQITPLTGSAAPTTDTVGALGKIYIDTSTATAYMCVVADDATPSYTWKQITA